VIDIFGDNVVATLAYPFFFLIALLMVLGFIGHSLFNKLPRDIYNILLSFSLVGGGALWIYLVFYAEWFPLYHGG
jgi:hypothetical protein